MEVLAYLGANEPALARVDDMMLGQIWRDWCDQDEQQPECRTWASRVLWDVDICETNNCKMDSGPVCERTIKDAVIGMRRKGKRPIYRTILSLYEGKNSASCLPSFRGQPFF